jgi:hypothetical protein
VADRRVGRQMARNAVRRTFCTLDIPAGSHTRRPRRRCLPQAPRAFCCQRMSRIPRGRATGNRSREWTSPRT